jgi:hypothetical protein
VVFTKDGRYFFSDQDGKLATWIPPKDLLENLLTMPERVLQAFFDPDTDDGAIMDMIYCINDGEDEAVEQVEFEFEEGEGEEEEVVDVEYDLEGVEERPGEVIAKSSSVPSVVPLSSEEAAVQHQAKITKFMVPS